MISEKPKKLLLAALALLCILPAGAQDTGEWTLARCIGYAREKNIQVQGSRITRELSAVELASAKAQRLPSLGFSLSQNIANSRKESESGRMGSSSNYTGSYSLDAGMTLYNGGKISNSIRQQQALGEGREYDVQRSENDIEIAVTQSYLQILYANEALKTNRQTLETSSAQQARAEELHKAGTISLSDLAQIRSQRSSDSYQVTVAENALAQAELDLKQLLELDFGTPFSVAFPSLDDITVLSPVPSLREVYTAALESMPEVKSSQKSIDAALLEEKIAYASHLPTVSLNAGLGTGNYSNSGISLSQQFNNRLNESAGLTLSLPIFNNRQARSTVQRAKLETTSARLDLTATQKELLNTVESLHRDVLSAQSRYRAASDKVEATRESYTLVSEQFDAGMKNTVELLTEKNNFLAAQQEQIQAKFQSILSLKLLNFYRNQPIEL